jgi:hypothetical protein
MKANKHLFESNKYENLQNQQQIMKSRKNMQSIGYICFEKRNNVILHIVGQYRLPHLASNEEYNG